MDFKLTEEQQMLQDTVARLVRDHYSFEQRERFRLSEAGFNPLFWAQLGELGLTAVPFTEELGGFGGDSVDTMLIMTELGRGLCLEPYMDSVILAGGLISQLGSPAQQSDLLPRIASGELKVAVATEELDSHYQLSSVQTRATLAAGGWRLSGRKSVVIGAPFAELIMVSARVAGEEDDEAGISLFVIDAAHAHARRRDYQTIDGRRASELYLDGVFVSDSQQLGETGKAFPALRYQQGRAIAAQCAEALGSMEEACSLTLDFLKTRKQFGQPIGKFQVLQHRMVDMRSELDQAASMVILAACVADDPDSLERSRALAAAKFIVTRAARHISEQAI